MNIFKKKLVVSRFVIAWLWLAVVVVAEDASVAPGPTAEDKSLWNVDSRTFGGKQFWTDEVVFQDWRIQKHALSGHYRLLDGKNVRRAWGDFADCISELEQTKQRGELAPLKPRVVIVLHGLVRSRESMEELCEFLSQGGNFSVLNVSYASTRGKLADHASALASIVQHLEGVTEVNFVAHSLGNLVVRHYLNSHWAKPMQNAQTPLRLGRIVMLAPPNNGAEMARRFQDNKLFQMVWGASGNQLATEWSHLEKQLAIPPCEFGIIAGGKGNADGLSPLVAGDDDFVVAVEETRLAGAGDFLILPVLHGSIMSDAKVQECTLRFLEVGCFVNSEMRRPIPRPESIHE